jgi:hypothetical protein
MSEEQHHDDEAYAAALDEALEGESPAAELRRMSALLRERRARLAEDLATTTDEKERLRLKKELDKLDEGARVLLEEAQINQFVEDAVRVGIEMRKLENQ